MIAQTITTQPAQKSTLITIEFTYKTHLSETQYQLKQPQLRFFDRVTLKNEYPQTEYVVRNMGIVESITETGKLLFQPYWIFRITNGEVSYWKEESALIRLDPPRGFFRDVPQTAKPTCTDCTYFQDYQEPNFFKVNGEKIANNNLGKGWCNCFNRPAKTYNRMTHDCILNGSSKESLKAFPTQEIVDEADLLHSQFKVGSLVKVIDPQEHHSEWSVFEIVEVKHNNHHFDSTDTYLNTQEWLYRLVTVKHQDTYSKSLWVGENEICHFDQSHIICTEEIF